MATMTAREQAFILSDASQQFDFDACNGFHGLEVQDTAKGYFEQFFSRVAEKDNTFRSEYRTFKYRQLGYNRERSDRGGRPVWACAYCNDLIQDDRPEYEERPIDLRRHIENVHHIEWSRNHLRRLGSLFYYADGGREILYDTGIHAGERWIVYRRSGRQQSGFNYWEPIYRVG